MFRTSIRRKIVGIAMGLVVLMVATSVLSMVMASKVGHLLDELNNKYIPAYGHLARANIRSLERSLVLRRMAMAKMQNHPDEASYTERLQIYQQSENKIEEEADAARKLIASIIADVSTPSDDVALTRIDTNIDNAVNDLNRHLNQESAQLLSQLESKDFDEARRTLARTDEVRDEFNRKLDQIRAEMLGQVNASASVVLRNQQHAILITIVVTALAAALGLLFAILVSGGITRPVRLLLQSTREVEAGRLDRSIEVITADEIGQLSAAFNRMVEQLRHKERIRETFGRYIDPRVVEGLINQPKLAAAEGQRRVMTIMFCDMKGFTTLSEGMTPQGLVKVMNRYLSTMSEPIHRHGGVIDKYIGDAIMAYWGPPFVEEADESQFACLAATEMIKRIGTLREEVTELLGVRVLPTECDVRIGVATGEALVGSIGSEIMMNYTVMGDTVNLAARLEAANKLYGTRSLIAEATVAKTDNAIQFREIDRLMVAGQTQPQAVFELLGRKDELTAKQDLLRTRYADGLLAYRAQRWDEARAAFHAVLEAVPTDGPSATLLSRIDHLQQHAPGADWDGSWRLENK
ncbi:MAG TPA: adenylate/guanylate cyclase domain-containing protein [Xanthobacteraceae bacterium]|jgi:class 3 adenylate cyclase|nr:adenylate/guanylate cyclase domain-containing protein [Xanthobacteraceae bacterium]